MFGISNIWRRADTAGAAAGSTGEGAMQQAGAGPFVPLPGDPSVGPHKSVGSKAGPRSKHVTSFLHKVSTSPGSSNHGARSECHK